MAVIAFEGLPRTGKTTNIEHLTGQFNVIPEIYDLDGLLAEVRPNDSHQNAQYNANLFLEFEKRRKSLLGNGNNVLDRSFLSNLGFSYALEKTFGYGNFDLVRHSYKEAILEGSIILPKKIFYLEPNPIAQQAELIRKELPGTESIWFDESFLRCVSDFYSNCFAILGKGVVVVPSRQTCEIDLLENECANDYKSLFAEDST